MSSQDNDTWAMSRVTGETESFLIRIRTGLSTAAGDPELPNALHVVWHGTLDQDAMAELENRLAEALERDRTAILAAVVTVLDRGTRRWTWYYSDRAAVQKRVNEALSGQPRYPIQLSTESDPDWECFRSLLRDAGLET